MKIKDPCPNCSGPIPSRMENQVWVGYRGKLLKFCCDMCKEEFLDQEFPTKEVEGDG